MSTLEERQALELQALDIAPLERFDMYAFLGLLRVMEPHTETLMQERAEAELTGDEYDSPHSRPWHVCLARQTEVVTRQGIREIGDLIGGAEILVPESGNKRSGRFLQCEVNSYGVDQTIRLHLRRHKQTKTIECTPAHRWYLDDGSTVLAKDLEAGQQLKTLRAQRNAKTMPVPFAVAQGFVYGDGASRLDGRPCHLDLFHNDKYRAMLPFFQMHTAVPLEREGSMSATRIKSLPRMWKELPDFRESRAFLLSWLSGYFCADGCVDERGYCTIDSASIESIKRARDILAVCGIGHGQIQQACVSGHYPNGEAYTGRVMYKLRISTHDLPEWFFQQSRHRDRAKLRRDRGGSTSRCWVVEYIEPGPTQEVFCATVPDHGCFGLADGLMTGNSFHGSEFPGAPQDACQRYLTYRMMNFPSLEAMPPWVTTTGTVGKAGELDIADAWYRGARLLAVPEDPDLKLERLRLVAAAVSRGDMEAARQHAERSDIHQLGFVDPDVWMTVSTDLPILPPGWRRPHIVEVKCLAGDTRVLTSRGRVPIRGLTAGPVELVNGRGEWQECRVRSFGEQQLWRITLRCGDSYRTIRATADHRWFHDATPSGEKHAVSTEVLTSQLRPGMKLTTRVPYSRVKKGGDTRPSPFGIARGIVYGDGTRKTSGGGSSVDLFGEKDAQLLRYFDGCRRNDLGNGGLRVTDLPRYFKLRPPQMDEGVSYIYGWLAGYFAADGTVAENGSCYLDCARRGPLEYVEDLCTYLGIPTRPIYEVQHGERRTPQGRTYPPTTAYRICIQAHGLTEAFFLIDEHRERWLGRGQETPSKRKDRWEVHMVHETHEVEEVFCAVVPGTEQFVLDGFILTGNCKADDVVNEMIDGRMIQHPDGRIEIVGRGPDPKHKIQLKATIGEANKFDWGTVGVCKSCWRILASDVISDLLGTPRGEYLPWSDSHGYCRWCKGYDVEFFELEPPTTGEIYYWSRSWPRKTKSFYFELDEPFMAAGKAHLAQAREHYILDTIPPRPDHFQWSVGPCARCQFKPFCRADDGVPGRKRKPDPKIVRTKLTESHGVAATLTKRPHYDPAATRERVFQEWR